MDSSQRALQTNEKLFFKFKISFQSFGWKLKNIPTNTEALIFIKCYIIYIYQRIRLNKLYKLMESFFSKISSSDYWLKNKKYSSCVNIDQSAMYSEMGMILILNHLIYS